MHKFLSLVVMISTPTKTKVEMLNPNPREVSDDDDTELNFLLFEDMSSLPIEESIMPMNFSPVTISSYNHFPGISPPNIHMLGDVDASFSLDTTRRKNYELSAFHDGVFISAETFVNYMHSPAPNQSDGFQRISTDCPYYSPFHSDLSPSFLKELEFHTPTPTTQATSARTKKKTKAKKTSRKSNDISTNERPIQHKFNVSTTCAWMKNYNALKRYVDLNGHCNIMQKEVWWNEESECLRLGNWVNKVCKPMLLCLHGVFVRCCSWVRVSQVNRLCFHT